MRPRDYRDRLLGLAIFHHGWEWLCASIAFLNLAMAGLAWNLEPDGAPVKPAAELPRKSRLEWRVFVVSLSLFLCSFGYGGVTSFVAMYAEKNGIEHRGVFFTVFSLAVLATRPFSGRLADRLGPRKLMVPCLALVVAAFALLAVATTITRMTGSALLFGLGFGNLYPIFVAHVMRFVDPSRHGAAFGAILAAFDTGIGTGSVAMGWIIQHAGNSEAYGLAAVLAVISIPVFLFTDRRFLAKSPLVPQAGFGA